MAPQLPLFLLTFNAAKIKLSGDFADHVIPVLPDSPSELYVFGFQEVCSVLDGSFPEVVNKHMIDINRIVLDTLQQKYCSADSPYTFSTVGLHHVGAVGMVAVSPFGLRFRDCRFATATCGALHSLLKGAVGLRVNYGPPEADPVGLTFACAHLNASEGEANYLKRVQDVLTVMRALEFGDDYSFLKPNCHTFFMGDLNFRTTKMLKKGVSNEALTDLLRLRDLSSSQDMTEEVLRYVKKYDELSAGRANGDLFTGFSEHQISFQPTYKYHLDTAIYNTKRCPLWCDRIMYQSTYKKQDLPDIHCYDSIDTYKRSDHRPVFLHISVPYTAPESIIGENGFLMVLPSALSHNAIDSLDANGPVSGPTLTFMKCTLLDKLNQIVLRRVSDFFIGHGLWFFTTPRGRVLVFAYCLVIWFVSIYI